MSAAKIRHHLAELLETDPCVPVTPQEISKIREGTYPQNKLKEIVAAMKAEGCGMAHAISIDPSKSSRLYTLSGNRYSVFKVDPSHDNVFHAFLHGVTFLFHHRPATAAVLTRATKVLRTIVVETVLKNSALQNAMARDGSRAYQRQFEVQYGSTGRRAFSEYSRKMRSSAFASYTEIAALSRYSDIEIHVYEKGARGFTFVARYAPTKASPKKKRYVIRLVRGSKSHFDVLIPNAYHAHHGFWNRVNKNLIGKLGGNAVNSPQNALAKLQNSKNNVKNGGENRLPNENVTTKNNFSWNASPKLNGGGGASSSSA